MSRKINFHFAENRGFQLGYEFFFSSKPCPNYLSNLQHSHLKSVQDFSEICSPQLPNFKMNLFILCTHYLYILKFNFQSYFIAMKIMLHRFHFYS